jgi:hypothetical protein
MSTKDPNMKKENLYLNQINTKVPWRTLKIIIKALWKEDVSL